MNPQARYTLVFYGNRDSYFWTRASLVTISGADSFRNESSSGFDSIPAVPLFSGPTSPSTRLPAGNTALGYVARFTNVRSGSDGTVTLSIYPQNYAGQAWQGWLCQRAQVEAYGGGGPPARVPLRFVVTGDSRGATPGVNWTALQEVAHAIANENPLPSFVLFPGDLVDGYNANLLDQFNNWKLAIAPLTTGGIKVYPIRGNHDTTWARMR